MDSTGEFVFAAPEPCRNKDVNASAGSVNKQAFGDNKDISFDEREMLHAGCVFLKEYLCQETKILLNKKSLGVQTRMFCFDNVGTGS